MKQFLKKNYLLIICILIQTVLYIITGASKEYLHIDEIYSYGLANYDKIEIQDNSDFYNQWHTKEYFKDYLSVQESEKWNFTPVYENQKNDVHPPLFYVLLRSIIELTPNYFSKWTGIGLNIILYAFITIFMYKILVKLLEDEKYVIQKATLLAFMSSIILASLSNVVYIRMYSLVTLIILVTTFLHMKLLESKIEKPKLLIAIGITTLAGVLTHYYYLFYLCFLYLVFAIKYIKEKNIKSFAHYTSTMIIAGAISLIIFPYSISHMFFGYRGQGVISNLENVQGMIQSIYPNIHNLNYYVFHNLLLCIIIFIIGLIIYIKCFKKARLQITKEEKLKLRMIYIPTIFFFIITAIASPWKVLRYIVPVCGLIFILVIYYLYKLLKTASNEKISSIIIGIIFCLMLISPFVFHLEPELLYRDRKELVQKLQGELNVPTIYLFNSQKGGFLDDMLLFSLIDESYIAKDINYTKENIQNILKGKDISRGIVVFISEEEETEFILQMVKNATGLNDSSHLKKLNSCNVYYLE